MEDCEILLCNYQSSALNSFKESGFALYFLGVWQDIVVAPDALPKGFMFLLLKLIKKRKSIVSSVVTSSLAPIRSCDVYVFKPCAMNFFKAFSVQKYPIKTIKSGSFCSILVQFRLLEVQSIIYDVYMRCSRPYYS